MVNIQIVVIGMESTPVITAEFRNFSVYRNRWAIKDGITDVVLFDDYLEPRNEGGDRITLSLETAGSDYGEARFKRSDQSVWSHKDFISDGDLIEMS